MQNGVYNCHITKKAALSNRITKGKIKMKKIIALVLATVLCFGCVCALSSCNQPVTRIGIQGGTTSEMYAKTLKNVEVVPFNSFSLAATDMKNGNVDYVMVDKTTAKAICSKIDGIKIVDIPFSNENYGIGIDPAQAALKDEINRILVEKAIQIAAIQAKYAAGLESTYVGVTSATKNLDNKAGQLVVATNAEFPPFESVETVDGVTTYYGIDMEIAALIADELNLELVIEEMEFDAVVGAVGKHGVDIAMSGITITAERLAVINFSNPYYTESIVMLCKADDTTFDSAGTVIDLLNIICYPED